MAPADDPPPDCILLFSGSVIAALSWVSKLLGCARSRALYMYSVGIGNDTSGKLLVNCISNKRKVSF